MIVSSKTMKPQNVAACAAPGTDHFSSFRWPITSVSWVSASPAGCDLAYATRSGAGCPENASRLSHHTRRPAIANAITVSPRPMIIRASISTPSHISKLSSINILLLEPEERKQYLQGKQISAADMS